jgi:hypothetical protein
MSAPRGGESLQFASPQNADVPQRLLQSAEPSVRLQVLSDVLGQPSDSRDVRLLREQVRMSSRVATLLSERDETGRIPHHPYSAKWYGAHWVLVALAELCYPQGDESLVPLRDQIMDWLFLATINAGRGAYMDCQRCMPPSTAMQSGPRFLSASLTNARSRWSSGYSTHSGRMAAGTVTGGRAGAPHPSPRVSFRCVPWPCTPG